MTSGSGMLLRIWISWFSLVPKPFMAARRPSASRVVSTGAWALGS